MLGLYSIEIGFRCYCLPDWINLFNLMKSVNGVLSTDHGIIEKIRKKFPKVFSEGRSERIV